MPSRFPRLVEISAWLFLAGILLGFAIPPAVELGRAVYVEKALRP